MWTVVFFCGIIKLMKNLPQEHYTPIQLKLPVEIEKRIKISDPVYSFSEVICHIDLNKYLTVEERRTGRPRYDEETLLKIILFAFMENGYATLSNVEKYHETDIRYMWLSGDNEPPRIVANIRTSRHTANARTTAISD